MKKSPALVVILGHQNNHEGDLSATARNRCAAAIKILRDNPTYSFTCTGAYGKNFNDSPLPHGLLLARFVQAAGISERRFAGLTSSANTVEDAVAVRREFATQYERIVVVTSPFHAPRVQFVFSRALLGFDVEYALADSAESDDSLADEARKFQRERRYMPAFERIAFETLSVDTITNLGTELRHYDSLSYYPILAIGGLLWVYQGSPSQGFGLELFGAIVVFLLTLLLARLYWRFADTARRFRSMIGISSFYLGQPSLPLVTPRWPDARWSVLMLSGLMFFAALVSRLAS